ncbi:ATP synthase F1 subunit delta [Bacilliculturomica massiliensis]|uniref:ATP synthase F1 subunit delta n=1 Tax=Bacilliculturomica massiliensis TaxID=1917867 RepID=UPI0010306D10|nr:ATP synthase F1 subunit delta [Bacilliculturomica massiliensis]
MIRIAESYGKALFDLDISPRIIAECKALLEDNPALAEALSSPAVANREKHRIIDRLFPDEIKNFAKVLCDNGRMGDIRLVEKVYEDCRLEEKNILQAELIYAKKLDPTRVEALKQALKKKYKKAGVKLTVRRDPSLAGGFILRVGDEEYDRSAKGRLTGLYRKLAWR